MVVHIPAVVAAVPTKLLAATADQAVVVTVGLNLVVLLHQVVQTLAAVAEAATAAVLLTVALVLLF